MGTMTLYDNIAKHNAKNHKNYAWQRKWHPSPFNGNVFNEIFLGNANENALTTIE